MALAADDVLLDDLLTRLDAVPGAADLLTGIAVYREPVDYNAVLFTAGQPDPAAEDIPDQAAAYQRIARDPGRRRDHRGRVRSTWPVFRKASGWSWRRTWPS